MEKAGFEKLIFGLLDRGLKIAEISTDRHGQIRKLMRIHPLLKNITHAIDPWHLIKGLKKKLTAKAKKKDCKIIGKWIECTSNHFWWSLQSSNNNTEELVEKFQSIVHHVINRHFWIGNKHFFECAHNELEQTEVRKIKWMKKDSKAHKEFKKIILHGNVRKDLLQMAGGIHTTLLEVMFTYNFIKL